MGYQPDRIDLRILEELQANCRLTMVELAKRVNLTKTPCSERVKHLEKAGIIRGYHAKLDLVAMESDHITFVQVLLRSTADADLALFNSQIANIPEVFGCHMVAGNFDYLLKVHTKDIYHFRSVLGNKISNLPGVQQTHSFVVMENVKDALDVPIVSPQS